MSKSESTIGRWISILHRYRKYYVNRKLESLGIVGCHYMFILTLSNHNGFSQEEISNHLKIDKTTTAKAIKRLEKDGFVTRQTNKNDKRAYNVYLTQKAWDALPTIHQAVEEWEKQMLTGITPEEYHQLEHLLQKMAKNVSDND